MTPQMTADAAVVEPDGDEVLEEEPIEADVAENDTAETLEEDLEEQPAEAEADYEAHLERRDADPEPVEFSPPPRRPKAALSTGFVAPAGGAEQMSPDPAVDDDLVGADDLDLDFAEIASNTTGPDDTDESAATETMPSYLRSSGDTLFGGGQSVADHLARRGLQPGPEDIDLGDDDDGGDRPAAASDGATESRGSAFLRGVWVVVQSILAVAFGAGLFIAFDQLWKWNNIVALVLSVLVILGLVVGVRVVRKTEDIGSTLIAVAVGALVTLGPLALIQSH